MKKMILEAEVEPMLTHDFPEMRIQADRNGEPTGIFRLAKDFARHTKHLIVNGDLPAMKKCFGFADSMLVDGSPLVRIAFQNVYLYSVTTFIDLLPSGQKLRELMTPNVKTFCSRHLAACGA
jgi:hypothetical protein